MAHNEKRLDLHIRLHGFEALPPGASRRLATDTLHARNFPKREEERGSDMNAMLYRTALMLLAGVVGFVAFGALHAGAQQKGATIREQVVGTWKMVSNVGMRDGNRTEAFGSAPNGMAIFTGDGRFTITASRSDIPKFVSGNRLQGTSEENKAIVQGSLALWGSYSVNEADKTLVLKVEGSTWPAWVGGEQKRPVQKLSADEMTWLNTAPSAGGTTEVVWRLVK